MNDMPIIIRRASLSDSAQLSEIYSYYVNNTAITFEDEAPTAEEFKGRMASVMSFYPYFVAEMNGVIIGYCYAGKFKDRSAYDWSVETTVFCRKGRGEGSVCCSRRGVEIAGHYKYVCLHRRA